MASPPLTPAAQESAYYEPTYQELLHQAMLRLSTLERTRSFFQIAGLVCIAGFAINLLLTFLPPAFGDLQWRAQMAQSLSDRGILLIFGAVLVMSGLVHNLALLRSVSYLCMTLGAVFLVSIVMVVSDSLTLSDYAVYTINNQSGQVLEQLQEEGKTTELVTPPSPQTSFQRPTEAESETEAEIAQQPAIRVLEDQAQQARRSAQTRILKTAVLAVTNLLAVGLGLIALGRTGVSFREGVQ